jgi:hypothetical protein
MKKFTEFNESKKEKKVFLGGTCNESTWREDLIKKLDIDYFNPVVKDWNDESYKEELKQREICDFLLYVITPKMTGVYSIAEVVDDSNKNPDKTIFCYLTTDKDDKDEEIKFSKGQIKSLDAVSKMVEKNGANCFTSLSEIADFLNKKANKD